MFWFGLAIGLVMGFAIRGFWKSHKLRESTAIIKNMDMSAEQKKTELYHLWKFYLLK